MVGNRGFASSIFRPICLVVSVCLFMFLLYEYSSTNSELKQSRDREDRLTKQQEILKTQVKDLLDARGKLEKDLQNMEAEQTKCIRDTEQLKKTYTSQIESMKETLKFRISSLENENSELQSRAGSYEEKYNELIAARKKDQDLFSNAQQKCHEATQKLEAQNAELNVQMSDLQRNLDTFRFDRLRSESIRQNCSNQLALSRMKIVQLQEEFQRLTAKLKVMGNAFSDNSPSLLKKDLPMDEHATQLHTTVIHTNDLERRSRELARQDVMRALQKKLARGDQLENSEKLLYQALAKEAGKAADSDLHFQPKLKEDTNIPSLLSKLSSKDEPVSKETQDLLRKVDNNVPAPPLLFDNKVSQKPPPVLFDSKVSQKPGETIKSNSKDVTDDQKTKTFEQDQRNEERRLFEMFQGDDNHAKDEFKIQDPKNEGVGQHTQNGGDKDDEDKDNVDKDDEDDDNYNGKDDDYVYGKQDRKVNPEQQNNNALI